VTFFLYMYIYYFYLLLIFQKEIKCWPNWQICVYGKKKGGGGGGRRGARAPFFLKTKRLATD
jgi:hypothetical protein